MIELKTRVRVKNLSARDVYDFMIDCTDEKYKRWWPEMHFAFHTINRVGNNYLGDLVVFDEMVGKRRLTFKAVITEAVPGQKITWQMKKMLLLPALLSLNLEDTQDGVSISHSLIAGYDTALGRILDPLIRLYLNTTFEEDLSIHANTEFKRLAELLNPR